MGNAVAILAHTRPGDEIVAYTKSHIFRYEGRLCLSCRLFNVVSPRCRWNNGPEDVKAAIRKAEVANRIIQIVVWFASRIHQT